MKPHVPLLLYGLLAGELATAVPVKGTVGPGRHVVVDDPMFEQAVNWPLPAQGPPRHSNMTATTLLTAPYKKKRALETAYDTYFNKLFPYWKTDVEVIPIMHPNEMQPVDEMQPNEMQPVDEKPAEKQSADQKPAEKKPTDKKPTDKKPTDKKPTDKKPTDKKPSDKKPTDNKPADKKPADKKPDAKKADNNPSAATTTKKPSPGSQRVTKNGPFKVVSANINNPANKQADSSSAAAATTTKKNDDSTCTDSSTFKKTEDGNGNKNNNGGNNNGNNINSGSTVYESNISNSTVDDSVINNSTVVDSRVLDSTVSDTTLLHSTVVDDVVIDDSTLQDTTVAGQSAVTEGSTLSGSDVLGGSAVAGGSTVIDSNILDGASVVDGSTVVGESLVGGGSAVAGDSNVFDGSVVTRRDLLLAKRTMPWMPDGAKIALCVFLPFICWPNAMQEIENQPKNVQRRRLVEDGSGSSVVTLAKRRLSEGARIAMCLLLPFGGCQFAMADEMEEMGMKVERRRLVDGGSDGGSGSNVVTLAKRVKSDLELTGMVLVCTFLPFLCPLYGDGREKRQLTDGGSGSGGGSSSSVVTVAKREAPMSPGAKVVVCLFFIILCPWAALSSGKDVPGNGPEKRELADGGDSFDDISDIDIPIMPIAKRLSKPARTTVCVLFPFICPLVWRRGLDPASQISSSSSSSSDNTALGKRSAEPEAKDGALRQCGAPLPWWCTNVTKRTTHLLPAVADAAAAEGSSSLLNKRKWTPTKFILCRILFVFCFTDLGTRDLAHAHAPTDDDNTTTVVAKKRSPQDIWAATAWTGIIDDMMKKEMDPPLPVMFVPSGDPPPLDEVDKKRRRRMRMRRSSVALDLTVDGNTVAHVAAEAEGKKSPLQIAVDYIMRVATGQVPSDPIVESKKKDGDDAKKTKREEESSWSPGSPPAPPVERSEVAVEGGSGGGNTDAAVAKRQFSWSKAISMLAGGTVIIEHFKEPIEALLGELDELFDRKRSVPPPQPAAEEPGAEEESMMPTKRDDHDHLPVSDLFMPPHFSGLPLLPKN